MESASTGSFSSVSAPKVCAIHKTQYEAGKSLMRPYLFTSQRRQRVGASMHHGFLDTHIENCPVEKIDRLVTSSPISQSTNFPTYRSAQAMHRSTPASTAGTSAVLTPRSWSGRVLNAGSVGARILTRAGLSLPSLRM